MNETIGKTDCPCCGQECDVRASKKGKPYIVCQSDECGYQGFARGEGAGVKLRAKMRPISAAIAAMKPAAPAAPPAKPAAPVNEFRNWLGLGL